MRILLSLLICASLAVPVLAKTTTTSRSVSHGRGTKVKKAKKFKSPKVKKMKKAKRVKRTTSQRAA